MVRLHLPLLALFAASCASTGGDALPTSPVVLAQEAGVDLTIPPYGEVHTQWKERLAQPYVYFDHQGTRESFAGTMRALVEFSVRSRVHTNGQPFGLFGPDGSARACLPVDQNPGHSGLPFAILPQAMVVYAVVSGPCPAQALPGLQQAMAKNGWHPRGPVREIYLVNTAEVATYDALATEIQVAWAELP